jgi:F-type H+-transporting ATPase subunit delta
LAKTTGSTHTITSDINNLREILNDTKELSEYLNNPLVQLKVKHSIVKKVITPQVSEHTSKFLMLLIDRKRISFLGPITERYLELVYELANIKIIEVISATKINEEQQQLLINKLQVMTKSKEIKLIITLDPSLIGGFLIKTNSQIIDLTVKGQLRELAKHLDSVLEI